MVGAGGFSYEETDEIAGVAVGTVKSRVSRARLALQHMLEGGQLRLDGAAPHDAMAAILAVIPGR